MVHKMQTLPLSEDGKTNKLEYIFDTVWINEYKERIDKKKDSIYNISGPHCIKVYVDQTKRSLDVRFEQHIAEIGKTQKTIEKGMFHNFKSKV